MINLTLRSGCAGLAVAFLATPFAALAANIQTGSAGGLQYQYIVGPGGCSAASPCQVVEYLHYLGGESQVPADLQSYFNTDAFWSAHPNTIVVAPQVNGSADDNNWGGVQSGVSSNGQAAVAAVRQIEGQYPTNPNTVVLTGGSMGGIGTEALMEEFGPKGTTGDHVYAAGLAYDGAVYNSSPASQKAALCGVPLVVQHGTADSTVNPGPDNALAQTLSGCPGFQYVQVPGAGHGTWGSGYTDGSQLAQVMASAVGSSSVQAAVSQPAAVPDASKAAKRVSPPPSSSQMTAYITVGEGTFKDAAGNTYSVRSDGAALMNDQLTPGGYGTQAMAYENGVVWGQDAHTNIWWTFSTSENGWTPTDTAPDGLPVQTPTPLQPAPVPAPPPLASGIPLVIPPTTLEQGKPDPTAQTQCYAGGPSRQFSVRDGKIVAPSGKVFIPQGVSVVDSTIPQVIDGSGNPLLTKFPKTNMVRIAVWSGYNQNDQGIINAVSTLTGMGIVVQINDYNAPNSIDAADVNQESEWVKVWAARYKDNPLVWFGSKNEPQNGFGMISSEHKSFYDAIRSTGNSSMISFDLVGGSGTIGLDGSVYAGMTNVSIDAHYYSGIAKYSADLSANQSALAAEVYAAQNLGQSADGIMPVFIGEWGNSTDGSNIDAGWMSVAKLVLSSGFGQVAWVYFVPGAAGDELTVGGGALTEFGRMVADGMGQNDVERMAGCDPAPTVVAGNAAFPHQTGGGPASSPPQASTPPTTSAIQPGTRDPFNTPFASDSVFNLPLGLGAQWQSNDQLSNSNVFINTVGNFNENIWKGTASDPLVTITNDASAGGTPGTFQVHIPLGAVPASGSDQTFSVDDTTTHTWYGFGGFTWTGPNTATVRQGSGESDSGSGLQVDNSNWDQGVGTLRQNDLQAGTIDHMLRVEMPFGMLKSYDPNSTTNLAPNAWPQTAEDGFAINGNGNPPYTGTIPYGVTVGIAASAVEPADVAGNPGADMLWKALQHHGAMIRDSGGSGNTVTFQADQSVDPNDPLIQGMMHFGGEIMAQTQILANQGPNSVNGGGQPVVPLNPVVNGQ